MGEIKIIDDILAPSDTLIIRHEGKNPFIAVTLIPKLVKDVMKIPGKDMFETDLRWDVTSDPRDFYGVWMGQRKEDKWTITKIRVLAQGEQSEKDKTGRIRIDLKGTIETNYNYSNLINRSFWWFYNYAFYYKQRRAYIDFAKDNIYKIREELLSAMNILKE